MLHLCSTFTNTVLNTQPDLPPKQYPRIPRVTSLPPPLPLKSSRRGIIPVHNSLAFFIAKHYAGT